MSARKDTPLSSVPGWDAEDVQKLASNWITTAEQVVGIAATAQGIQSLAQQLGTSESKMHRLLKQARVALHPDVVAELARAADTSEYGLGALPPEDSL